jgi:hypothetical protein
MERSREPTKSYSVSYKFTQAGFIMASVHGQVVAGEDDEEDEDEDFSPNEVQIGRGFCVDGDRIMLVMLV